MHTPLFDRVPVPSARSSRTTRTRLSAALVLAAMLATQLTWVSAVRADDTAKAKAMFIEGLALEQTKDFSNALAKFEAVAKVKKTPQVMFHVAYCLEQVGRMVDALALYKETLAEATAGAADPKLAQVKTTTAEAIATLEKKMPTVTVISKGPKPAGAEITLDGKKLAALDTPEKVDPGVHTVEAKADGKEPFSAKVDAPEATQRTVEIRWKDVKKSDDDSDESEAAKPPPSPPPPPPPVSSSKLPYVVGGIGVASLIASGVFFGIRTSAQSELEDKCQGTLCPESVRATGDKGKTATMVTNVTLVVGLVGLGAGITLYALDSKKTPAAASLAPKPTRLRAGVSAVPGAGFATFSGAFLAVSPSARLRHSASCHAPRGSLPMLFRRAAALLPVLFVACSFPDYTFDDARFNAQNGDGGEGGSGVGKAGTAGKGGTSLVAGSGGSGGLGGAEGGAAGEGGKAGEGGSGGLGGAAAGEGGSSSGAAGIGGTSAGGEAGTGGVAGSSSGAGGTSGTGGGSGTAGAAGKAGGPAGTCTTAADCKATESCSDLVKIGSETYFKCFKKNTDAGAAKPGGLCDSPSDCESFGCLLHAQAAAKGTCSGTCGTNADCVAGGVCFPANLSKNSQVRVCSIGCLSDAGCDPGLGATCSIYEDVVSDTLGFACTGSAGVGFGATPAAGEQCKSGVTIGMQCTKPCEGPAECGPPFPACKSGPIDKASGNKEIIKVCTTQ